MKAIFKREFKAYFSTLTGYVLLAIYFLVLGVIFSLIFENGSAITDDLILTGALLVPFTVPVMTMRLLCEERRQKIDQVIFTAPVSLTSVVLGKFFAALALFALCFAPTLIYQIIVISYVGFTCVPYLYALLGVLLLGSAFIAIGMFISSLTENIAISAVLSLIINFFLYYLSGVSSFTTSEWFQKVAVKISFGDILQNFGVQRFSVPDVVYFLSITVGFLFLCVRSLEKRRWS